jgi:hypothetical protein
VNLAFKEHDMKITIVKKGSVVKLVDGACPWLVDYPNEPRT